MSLIPPSNRFYCDKCDTDFDVMSPFDYPVWTALCPNCNNHIKKNPVCGICHEMLGKKSKGIKCGHCGAKFNNTKQYEHYLQTTKEKECQP